MKVTIPGDWDGASWCRWSICWPDSDLWKAILFGFLTTAQRGRFWDENSGNIKQAQEIGRQIFDNNFPLECVIMSCSDATALIEAINTNFSGLSEALIEAINSLQLSVTVQSASPDITIQPVAPAITVQPATPDITLTCSPDVNLTCAGGYSGVYPPSSPGFGPYGQGPVIQPPANPGQVTPGPGPGNYLPPSDWTGTAPEYNEYKCRAANFLVGWYINYVEGWTRNVENILDMNSITTWLWAIFEASPWVVLLSPNLIPLIGSYLVTLEVGGSVGENLLDAYLDYLVQSREDWTCDMYNALTVADARLVCENYIGGGGAVAWPQAVRDFHVDAFCRNNVLNLLFEQNAIVADYPLTTDCTLCDDCPEIEVDLSTRQFLNSYSGPGGNNYVSSGASSSQMVGEDLNMLTAAGSGLRSGIYRFDVANPNNFQFSRFLMPNQTGACCAAYYVLMAEDENGIPVTLFASNAAPGSSYNSAGNFTPIVVKSLVLYVANSISQGVDTTIQQLILTCAI